MSNCKTPGLLVPNKLAYEQSIVQHRTINKFNVQIFINFLQIYYFIHYGFKFNKLPQVPNLCYHLMFIYFLTFPFFFYIDFTVLFCCTIFVLLIYVLIYFIFFI